MAHNHIHTPIHLLGTLSLWLLLLLYRRSRSRTVSTIIVRDKYHLRRTDYSCNEPESVQSRDPKRTVQNEVDRNERTSKNVNMYTVLTSGYDENAWDFLAIIT